MISGILFSFLIFFPFLTTGKMDNMTSTGRSLISNLNRVATQAVVKPSVETVHNIVGALSPGQNKPSYDNADSMSSVKASKVHGEGAQNDKEPIDEIIKILDRLFDIVSKGPMRFEDNANALVNVTRQVAGGLIKTAAKTSHTVRREDDMVYYNRLTYIPTDDYLRPKYFSTDCSFRFCCELGRWMFRPYSPDLVKRIVLENKFIHDLQNRFTRAATYGYLYGDCSKYYCVVLELTGGPVKFAAGVTELANRFLNPDLYT